MFSESELDKLRKLTDDTYGIHDILDDKEINAVNESTTRLDNIKSHVLAPITNQELSLVLLKKMVINLNVKKWLEKISKVLTYNQEDGVKVWVSFLHFTFYIYHEKDWI